MKYILALAILISLSACTYLREKREASERQDKAFWKSICEQDPENLISADSMQTCMERQRTHALQMEQTRQSDMIFQQQERDRVREDYFRNQNKEIKKMQEKYGNPK